MRVLPAAATLMLLAGAVAGCLSGDESPAGQPTAPAGPALDPHSYRGDPYAYPDVQGFGETTSTPADGGGQGIWVHEGILYRTNGADLHIFDVSDPAAPTALGEVLAIGARDVDVLELDGRTYAFLAPNGPRMRVVDVTDPALPEVVGAAATNVGVHNLAAVPGTPYVYVSGASGGRMIDVVDFTDIQAPVVHSFPIPAEMNGVALNSDGCHDITVRVDLGRAYCAGGGGQYMSGGGETFIWDITPAAGGPLDPTWVSFMDDPRVVYNHQAMVNDDGTILIVDDEFIAPNCLAVDIPAAPGILDPQVPTGAAWIWDISDEANPRLMSFIQNDALTRHVANDPGLLAQDVNCGSHFGDIIPGNDKFVMGWYGGGTVLIDYSDPASPAILDVVEAAGSTWDARVYNGHVFHSSGDLLVTPLA